MVSRNGRLTVVVTTDTSIGALLFWASTALTSAERVLGREFLPVAAA